MCLFDYMQCCASRDMFIRVTICAISAGVYKDQTRNNSVTVNLCTVNYKFL